MSNSDTGPAGHSQEGKPTTGRFGGFNEKIAAVLARLPVLEQKRHTIEREALNLSIVYALYRTQDAPRARAGGTKKAVRELETFRKRLFKVCESIHAMPFETHAALDAERKLAEVRRKANEARGQFQRVDSVPNLLGFDTTMLALAAAAEAARQTLLADPNPTKGTKPRKIAAATVARHAAGVYERLTGNCAAVIIDADEPSHPARGSFLELVRDLFDAVEIEARPTHYARQAVNRRRKAQVK